MASWKRGRALGRCLGAFVMGGWLIPASAADGAPTALVLEFEDHWTSATGAVALCEQAGFTVRTQNFAEPPALDGVDLALFGSFISEHPAYSNWVQQARAGLVQFVEEGGVLLQLTQADQTETTPPFLPDGLRARRSDTDLATLWIVSGDHPLLESLPRQGDQIFIPTHLGRPANWESLSFQSGFKVLLASDPGPADYALIEAAHGAGRFLLSSLFLDKIYRSGTVVDATVADIARQFFANLKHYVESVRAGTAPDVVPTRPPEPLPFVPGSWTIAVLPDTQYYTRANPGIFEAQTRWIADRRQDRNIVFVLQLGDITDNNQPYQWENARRAFSILDGEVPYAFVPGNHDYGNNGSANVRQTLLNNYFFHSNYVDRPTFGGAMMPGRMENTFHTFRAGGEDWLVLALEWGPRNSVVDWADQIVSGHPNHKVILITHAYLYFDNTRYDWPVKGASQAWNPYAYGTANDPDGTNDGEDLWRKLVRKHPGFVMTVNGHVLNDGLGRLSSWGDHSNIVHQLLVNYQVRAQGGEGYLRLMEFLPDGKTVQVKAYSPYLDSYLTDGQNQFILDLDPPPPSPPDSTSAPILFEDDFDRGIDGWTAVQPEGAYSAGPMRWQYDIVSGSFVEQSNIYTDSATASPTATAVMLINQAVTPESFTFRARPQAGDDDGFGLVFGYQDEGNFYRVTFSRQRRTTAGFPWNGWSVDRRNNGVSTVLFGDGSPGHVGSFTNVAGRPFAVTVGVTTDQRLNLTVVDNPDVAPIVYRLVQNGTLPVSAAGRVGLMSWGMSGGVPLGFRMAGLSLDPVPLAGNPNTLAGWTPVVPPQANGNTTLAGGNGGQPLWSLGLGSSGPLGSLIENSDSAAPGTDVGGNFNVDFTGPCLVTGSLTWSNYTVRARVRPGDDGGHGLLVRYQDPGDFCRVTLCGVAGDPTGRPPPGLSIQKVVTGQWQEVFRESGTPHVPAPGTPCELAVTVRDRFLFVHLTLDPDNLGSSAVFGPFEIAEPSLDHGGIGLFSWGMSQTEFDSVRVEGLLPLRITRVRLAETALVIAVQNPAGWPYDVESTDDLAGGLWGRTLAAQTAREITVPLGSQRPSEFWRLKEVE